MNNDLPAAVVLAEYAERKDEQRDRMRRRDDLSRTTWAALAAVLVATYKLGDWSLLLLAPAALVLGWTYLRNDSMVTAIRRYLVAEVRPRLGTDALGWESARGPSRTRTVTKLAQTAADLATFVLPAFAGATAYLIVGSEPLLLAVAAVEAVAAAGLAALFVAALDLSRS